MSESKNSKPSAKSALPDALGVGRGVAIIAMMYGHALTPWVLASPAYFNEAAFLQWKLGASFLMMFFFFVSGISWRETSSLRSTMRQSLGLILIAWTATVLLEIVRLGITAAHLSWLFDQRPNDLWQFIKNVGRSAVFGTDYTMATMWFLTTLGIARLIAALCVRRGPVVCVVASLALIALGLVVTATGFRNVYQVSSLGVGLSAFLLGHAAKPLYNWIVGRERAVIAACLICLALLLGTFWLNRGCTFDVTGVCGFEFLGNRFAVALSLGVLGNLPLFAFTAIAGSLFATAFSILIARRARPLGWQLAIVGRNTVALLVVNGAMLEWVHPLIVRYIAPSAPADQWYFYLGLFAFTVVANLGLAALLHRPLKAWFATAMKVAQIIVDAPMKAWRALHAAQRPRVSEAGE